MTWLRTLTTVLVGVVLALGAASPAVASGILSVDEPGGRVVLVGAPGLSWTDIDPTVTPVLDEVAQEGAVAALTVRAVRSRACAVDGWLTLSAGRRAADLPGPCRAPQPVGPDGLVPQWDDYLDAARADSYGAVPGTLGSSLADAVPCVAAVGPGAAIGAADEAGRADVVSGLEAALDCPVALVDGGTLPADPAARTAALRDLDALVGEVRALAAPGTRIAVAGLGDGESPVRPRAVMVTGGPAGVLTSPSTRQPGLVLLQDLTASLVAWTGASAPGLTGRPVTVMPDDRSAEDRVAGLQGFEVRAGTLRSLSPQVTGWLAAGFALWCLVAGIHLWRRGRVAGPVLVAGVAVAAVPVSTFAANLVPWWRAGSPSLAFAATLAVVVGVVTAVAVLAERRRTLGALLAVSLLTLVVIGGDVLTGSGLQLASVFGQNPTVGGRFYGVGNTSYALYGVAALAVVGVVATTRELRRGLRLALAAVVLLAVIVVEGAPALGADFGGPPGLLLGGLVVLAGASGLRFTATRVVGAVAGVAVLTAVVAVLDWLRPAESRTHLGEFVQTVVDGGLADVLSRKVSQNLANLTSPPLLTVSLAALALALVAGRVGWRPSAPGALVLRGSAVLAAVGFAVNDSGLVIPAFAALVLLPLLAVDRSASPRARGSGRGGGRLDELDEHSAGILGVDEVHP